MFNARLTALAGIALALSACNTATVPGSSGLTSGVWTPTGPIQVASVIGGPWTLGTGTLGTGTLGTGTLGTGTLGTGTLGQNGATLGHAMAGYCDT